MRLRLLFVMCFFLTLPAQLFAGFDEGLAAGKSGDFATALREWLPLANDGHALSQYWLGSLYNNGYGVAKDTAEAVKWYRKAADQGLAYAQTNLGVLYYMGDGVTQDKAVAAKWYRKAAEQGETGAQVNLAVMYERDKPWHKT